MKSAAIQVEMDEVSLFLPQQNFLLFPFLIMISHPMIQFMTLRRLNIRIQGFPESYATDPAMADMVVGEARPMPVASNLTRSTMMPTPDSPMMGVGGPEAPRSSPHPGTPMSGPAVPPGPLMNEPAKV